MNWISHYDSPLGGMTMASDGESLTGLWFDRQRFFGAGTDSSGRETCCLPVFDETCQWLDVYFAGRVPDFTPPLAPRGTPFREAVWQILLTIPYGQTMTYGEIADRMARQRAAQRVAAPEVAMQQGLAQRIAAQAVGGAVGHNPIAIIVPCHRVVGAGGSLTGYAAGLDRKRRLLQLENIL